MKINRVLSMILIVAAFGMLSGCGDSGDSPTGPTKPALTVSNPNVDEGANASFAVSLSVASAGRVIFDYESVDGTALSTADYTAVSGRDTIEAGQTSVTISVTSTDDATTEVAETFSFNVVLVSGEVTIGDGSGTCTIAASDGVVGVSFATDVRPILTSRCAISSCHGSGSVSGGMSMGEATWTEIVSASGAHGAIVSSGNSGSSNLYLKTTSSPPFGSQMPLTGAKLSTVDQQKIRDWIDQGALNN